MCRICCTSGVQAVQAQRFAPKKLARETAQNIAMSTLLMGVLKPVAKTMPQGKAPKVKVKAPEAGLGEQKIYASGLGTSIPSNKMVAPRIPDAGSQSPSLKTNTSIPSSTISSSRYTSPSQRINLDDFTVPIQSHINTSLKILLCGVQDMLYTLCGLGIRSMSKW